MLKTLLCKQLTEIFRSYFYDAKKNKARSKGASIAYIIFFVVLMVVVLGGMFTLLSVAICQPMAEVNMDWLYFALLGLLAILLGAFGSVFNTYSGLYLAKDNDLLLSMPIPVSMIMISRLLGVYLMGLMYSGIVILPAIIVYIVLVSASMQVILGCLLLLFLISIFVLTLSCALGWVVAKISVKLKNKSLVTVLISLVLIGGYYFFYYKAQSMIGDLIANAALYGAKIKGTAYPIYLFGNVGLGRPVPVLSVSAVILTLFFLTWMLISRSFLRIATTADHGTAKKKYKGVSRKKRGVFGALLAKEFSRFITSPGYMLNCGLGILLLPIGAVALLWRGGTLMSVLNSLFSSDTGMIPLLLCTIICFLISMNDMTAPSVSLEGKSLWIIQSLPIKPWQVLRAKISMQVILSGIPALLCVICAAMIYPFTPIELLLTVLFVGLFVLFMAVFGLFLGIKMPNLSWTNEMTPIKQSASVMLSLLGGFVYVALFCVVYLLVGSRWMRFEIYMAIFTVLTAGLCALLCGWLKKKGSKILAAL